jgi:integron integrase
LLERAWDALLGAGLAEAVARQYVGWMRDYVLFHGKRHPREMGVPEVRAFLADGRFSGPAAGQRVEATAAIRFLYEVVLQRRWPRGVLDAPGEGSGAGTGDQPPAVYLNGRQPGVKLLDRVRNALRVGQYALETEKTYVAWIKKYILFHGVRHPEEMGAVEVEQFLTHLAAKRGVAKDTQRQALNALVFLYRTVLGRELGKIMPVRGRHGQRLPVVLTRKEVPRVLQLVEGGCGVHKLMAELLYGSGVRIKECCRLRVKDVDLERLQLAVRSGKGDQDRVTVLPRRLVDRLREQIARVRRLHEDDLALGLGRVWLPPALRRKYPNADRELGWQYLFPSNRLSIDPREHEERIRRRHHVHVDSLQKAIRAAALKAGLTKRVTPHVFRHSFATHLLEHGENIRKVQELLGHKDIQTTMIYLHVMEGGTTDVCSPLDLLEDA